MSRYASRATKLVTLFTVLGLLFAVTIPSAFAEDSPLPLPVTHQHFNFMDPLLSPSVSGHPGEAQYKNPSSPICSNATSSDPNVNTDCEGNAPHNETSIAVNPTNPQNLIGSANDYQLNLSSGGTVNETTFSRAHVSFDGGQTWVTYPVYYRGYTSTGDPAVAFDASGNAYLATLGFTWSQNRGCCINPDILVATSSDGGKSWSRPARVASGKGYFTTPGKFNDKEYITAWGDGNAIVTWTIFNQGVGGSYINSPIYASVTHDAGKSWTAPTEISGSASFCIGAQGGNACDQSQASVPVVAADGSIYVSFLSTANTTDFRDQYLVVKVDPNTGQSVAGPYKVADVFDGLSDYPINIDGRQTYQDSQFRTWAAGNIAADPTDANHLAVIWSDMRNSVLPAPTNPYAASTNSDVIVSQSFDGGQTWSSATALNLPGDQFMPWGSFNGNGLLKIGFFDRSYDPANHAYGFTLATEVSSGSLNFNFTAFTNTLSNPTQDTRWFSGRTANASFPNPTTFLGDYGNIAVNAGNTFGFWTDMREPVTFGSRTGSGENAYFGAMP